ncbi:remorin [Capsicum annuum]|uniref:remorin n=1 Tax=Capsicum annuum TaxID=4072 RepID=UPI0007BEDE99|nr:remorin [Capsicum annuum]
MSVDRTQKKVSAIGANSKKANLEVEFKKMEEELKTKKAQYTEKMKNKTTGNMPLQHLYQHNLTSTTPSLAAPSNLARTMP